VSDLLPGVFVNKAEQFSGGTVWAFLIALWRYKCSMNSTAWSWLV